MDRLDRELFALTDPLGFTAYVLRQLTRARTRKTKKDFMEIVLSDEFGGDVIWIGDEDDLAEDMEGEES